MSQAERVDNTYLGIWGGVIYIYIWGIYIYTGIWGGVSLYSHLHESECV